mgnify:CR=1 FL=1
MDNYDKQLHLYQNLNNMQNIMQSRDYKSNQEVSLEVHSAVQETKNSLSFFGRVSVNIEYFLLKSTNISLSYCFSTSSCPSLNLSTY